MQGVQLDEKTSERMKAIRTFTLMDDTFMTQVFAGDADCTQELLRHLLLKRQDLTVTKSVTQLTIGNLLWALGAAGYLMPTTPQASSMTIEVQQEDKGARPERARLNSALFDSRLTTAGESYAELPETYIIFITANDVLKDGLPVYTIERTIQETGKLFGDRAHIVYVNGAYRGEDEVGQLMRDFNCNDYRKIREPQNRSKSAIFQRRNGRSGSYVQDHAGHRRPGTGRSRNH